jgi:DNA polymerase III delta prime subunit
MSTEKLFWNIYRPTKISDENSLDEVIILPRLKRIFEQPFSLNMIFYGSPGLGKTTIARALIEPYDHLIINASLNTGIDTLRNEITDFCNIMSFNENDIKIVFFEEFDGASRQTQDALKAFVEEYENDIRFIITTNVKSKLTGPILSRFKTIEFDPQNSEEQKWLKTEYAKRIQLISKDNDISLDRGQIISIVNRFFPDFRSILNELQYLKISKDYKIDYIDDSLKNSLLEIVFSSMDNNEVFNYLFDNIDTDSKIELCFDILGRDFLKKIFTRKDISQKKLNDILEIHRAYVSSRQDIIDPLVHLFGIITRYQFVINS